MSFKILLECPAISEFFLELKIDVIVSDYVESNHDKAIWLTD